MAAAKTRMAVLLLAVATACATAGGKAGTSDKDRYYQADYKFPAFTVFDEAERGKMKDANQYFDRGVIAQENGNADQARAEFGTAADQYVAFVDQFPSSEWRLPILNRATELYLQSQKFDKAAQTAERIARDPMAKPASQAIGARYAASAWLNAANAKTKAGQLEGIRLQNFDQRKDKPNPRVPPGEWKRFVDAADAYVPVMKADPEFSKSAADRRGIPPAQLELIAAEVEYAFDNMQEAQAQAGSATDPKAKEAYAKVLDVLSRAEAGTQFASAQKLLDAGKPAEAAQAFEAVAADPKGGDVANALHNAAVAWDKAQQPDKAAALRERIVNDYATSKVAPNNALLLAVYRSKKGSHAEAAKIYEQFLQKWPDSPNRCVALQNVASELDIGKKPVDAAARYVAFGKDAQCTKADPNTAARALYRAGRLYQETKQKAKAKEAYALAAGVDGVTDTVAKSQVDDAKRRMNSL
jgi:outer membrane protein assembly factor BamD (BamD/ComL family)